MAAESTPPVPEVKDHQPVVIDLNTIASDVRTVIVERIARVLNGYNESSFYDRCFAGCRAPRKLLKKVVIDGQNCYSSIRALKLSKRDWSL